MAEKKTFKQAMGQEKMNKKKAVYLLSAGLAGLVILVVIFLALSSGDDETSAPTTVSTPMVPTNLRYYDPLQEETYETGVNYVILNQSDGSRIRVSDDGRVVEVDERGNIVREIENGDEYISTVTGLMENDLDEIYLRLCDSQILSIRLGIPHHIPERSIPLSRALFARRPWNYHIKAVLKAVCGKRYCPIVAQTPKALRS